MSPKCFAVLKQRSCGAIMGNQDKLRKYEWGLEYDGWINGPHSNPSCHQMSSE